MPPKPQRPRGRPPADPSGTQVKCHVRLSPAERQWVEQTYGTVNAGLRTLVAQAMTAAQRPAR